MSTLDTSISATGTQGQPWVTKQIVRLPLAAPGCPHTGQLPLAAPGCPQSLVSRHIDMPTDNGLVVPSAIARSPCHNQSSLTLQQVLPSPSQSLAMFRPYPHLMPPVEEGERCHVCDQSAWGLTNHICWCRECALALLPVRNVSALMIVPKCAVAMDAHLHANRWIRILLRLIAYVPLNPENERLPFHVCTKIKLMLARRLNQQLSLNRHLCLNMRTESAPKHLNLDHMT